MAVVIDTQNKTLLFVQNVVLAMMDKGIITDEEIKAYIAKLDARSLDAGAKTQVPTVSTSVEALESRKDEPAQA